MLAELQTGFGEQKSLPGFDFLEGELGDWARTKFTNTMRAGLAGVWDDNFDDVRAHIARATVAGFGGVRWWSDFLRIDTQWVGHDLVADSPVVEAAMLMAAIESQAYAGLRGKQKFNFSEMWAETPLSELAARSETVVHGLANRLSIARSAQSGAKIGTKFDFNTESLIVTGLGEPGFAGSMKEFGVVAMRGFCKGCGLSPDVYCSANRGADGDVASGEAWYFIIDDNPSVLAPERELDYKLRMLADLVPLVQLARTNWLSVIYPSEGDSPIEILQEKTILFLLGTGIIQRRIEAEGGKDPNLVVEDVFRKKRFWLDGYD